MTKNLEVAPAVRTLIKAKKLLEEKGWIRECYHDKDGYCLIGAVNSASRRSLGDDPPRDVQALLRRAIWGPPTLRNGYDYHWTDMFDWNDAHTKEDVLAVLDRAISLGLGVP